MNAAVAKARPSLEEIPICLWRDDLTYRNEVRQYNSWHGIRAKLKSSMLSDNENDPHGYIEVAYKSSSPSSHPKTTQRQTISCAHQGTHSQHSSWIFQAIEADNNTSTLRWAVLNRRDYWPFYHYQYRVPLVLHLYSIYSLSMPHFHPSSSHPHNSDIQKDEWGCSYANLRMSALSQSSTNQALKINSQGWVSGTNGSIPLFLNTKGRRATVTNAMCCLQPSSLESRH